MLEGSTTSKTTLRTSLVLLWLDDSRHSNQGLDKTIDSTTDPEEQSMKISSFFNTRTHTHTRISLWNELSRTSFHFPTLQVVVQLNQLAQGIQHRFLEKRWFTRNQLDHKLNITVRGQPSNTSEKIFGKSRTTDMSLGLRSILPFRARRYDQISKGLIIQTHWSKSAPGKWTR